MSKTFNVGDHVRWNSEAGHVSGHITKIHTSDTQYKGHTRHCSKDDPQYEIKSDPTDHVAMHKGEALEHVVPEASVFDALLQCARCAGRPQVRHYSTSPRLIFL